MQSKKFLSVLLTLLMMAGVIAVAPVVASAADLTAGDATELATALATAGDNTIKLLNDITYTDPIQFIEKTITLDLNGKTLNATGGLDVENGAELLLSDPNNGAFNVSGISGEDTTIGCYSDCKVEVTNVTCSANNSVAVFAGGGEVIVYGNVTHTGTSYIGVNAKQNGKITIDGTITVSSGAAYIVVEETTKTQAQYELTSIYPYLTYKATGSEGTSYVYVKNAAAFKAVTVTGGTGSGNYVPGAAVAIVATVPAGKLFDKWTATGVTLTEAQKGSASTNFTMPAGAVTVTASFKDAKGIFGTKARWTGEWWHYLLFFLCFGFIWMWFI